METIQGSLVSRAEEILLRERERLDRVIDRELIRDVVDQVKISRFDYERVLLDSAYGVGLIGVGYLAVKFGKILWAITNPVEWFTSGELEYFMKWVEGENKNIDVTKLFGYYLPYNDLRRVEEFRNDPELWAAYKAEFEKKQPPKDMVFWIIDQLDNIYTKYGAIAPVALVSLLVIRERRRMRGE